MFCTNCGSAITPTQQFCTSCGRGINTDAETASVTTATNLTTATLEIPVSQVKRRRGRIFLVAALAIVIGIASGTALTATGIAEFAIGVRFTQDELNAATEKAQRRGYNQGDEVGFDRGYKAGSAAGYKNGYSMGQSNGYSSGKRDGCNSVFDEIGENLIAIRYPWYTRNVYGYRYSRSSIC